MELFDLYNFLREWTVNLNNLTFHLPRVTTINLTTTHYTSRPAWFHVETFVVDFTVTIFSCININGSQTWYMTKNTTDMNLLELNGLEREKKCVDFLEGYGILQETKQNAPNKTVTRWRKWEKHDYWSKIYEEICNRIFYDRSISPFFDAGGFRLPLNQILRLFQPVIELLNDTLRII